MSATTTARENHSRCRWTALRDLSCGALGSRSVNVDPSPTVLDDSQIAVHGPREIAADRQTESRALGRPRIAGVDSNKGREDLFQLFGGDSASAVANVDVHGIRCLRRAQLNLTLRRRVLGRVREHVEHDLLQLFAIGVHSQLGIDRRVLVPE